MPTISNDHVSLIPRTTFDGPALEFDFPGLLIGVAEYDEGPTGCTVFRFPGGAATAVDERGGSVGKSQRYTFSSAICLAGGSIMGLEAASGVAAGLFAQNGYDLEAELPMVNAAILYDFGVRENRIYPDRALGRAALEAARPGVFPLGARGAGRSASVGWTFDFQQSEPSGQGAAFRQLGEIKIVVFTVVNALGAVHDRSGQIVRGNRHRDTNQREPLLLELERRVAENLSTQPPSGNTTLTVLVTNHKLDPHLLNQFGRQVHTSLARVIHPFHTPDDGDILYAVTTNQVESRVSCSALGMVASELAWDAVLSAVSQ